MRSCALLLCILVAHGSPHSQGQESLTRELIDKLRSEKVEDREDAERKLTELGVPALPSLRKIALDPDQEVASRAKFIISLIEIRSRIPPEVLKANPGVERQVFHGRKTLFAAFQQAAGTSVSGSSYSREAIAQFTGEIIKERLDAHQVEQVVEVIGHHEIKEHWKYLVKVAGDPTLKGVTRRDIHLAAAGTLGRFKIPDSSPDFIRFLSHADGEVRGVAARALADLGQREAVPRIHDLDERGYFPKIEKAVRDFDGQQDQMSLVLPLVRARWEESTALLTSLLGRHSSGGPAALALGRLGHKGALPYLAKIASLSYNPHEREEALVVLNHFRAADLYKSLTDMRLHQPLFEGSLREFAQVFTKETSVPVTFEPRLEEGRGSKRLSIVSRFPISAEKVLVMAARELDSWHTCFVFEGRSIQVVSWPDAITLWREFLTR